MTFKEILEKTKHFDVDLITDGELDCEVKKTL